MAKRFMDDILLVYADGSDWDSDAMIMDFETNCYHSPLTLENAKENTFLESTFKIENKVAPCAAARPATGPRFQLTSRYVHGRASQPRSIELSTSAVSV